MIFLVVLNAFRETHILKMIRACPATCQSLEKIGNFGYFVLRCYQSNLSKFELSSCLALVAEYVFCQMQLDLLASIHQGVCQSPCFPFQAAQLKSVKNAHVGWVIDLLYRRLSRIAAIKQQNLMFENTTLKAQLASFLYSPYLTPKKEANSQYQDWHKPPEPPTYNP